MKRLLLLGALLGAVGCQGSGPRIPADPLFVSRRPIESRAAYGPPTRTACEESPASPLVELTPVVRAAGSETAVASAR